MHQRQKNPVDNLLDGFVQSALERHQDLVACKVCRKRHNPRGEACSGDLPTFNGAPHETTIHGKSTACCAFPITTNGFVKKIGSEVEIAAARRRLASSAQRISRLNDIGSPA